MYFLIVVEARSLRSRWQCYWLLMRALFLVIDSYPLAVLSYDREKEREQALWCLGVFFVKAVIPSWWSTSRLSKPKYFPQRIIFKYHHIRSQDLKHVNFGRQFSPWQLGIGSDPTFSRLHNNNLWTVSLLLETARNFILIMFPHVFRKSL